MPESTAVAGEATRADLDLSRVARAAGWVAFALAFGLEALAILRANQTWLVHRLPDDAYYYLEVGVRIARGHGATFDGLHRTNGFHPLWEATISLLALVFHGQALVRAVLLTELAMGAVALLVCYRLLVSVWGSGIALFAIVVASHGLAAMAVLSDGMESGAVVLALALLAWALSAYFGQPDARSARWCGAAASVVVLARVDFAVVIALVAIAMWWRARSVRDVGVAAGVGALVVAPWVVWSEIWVGHVLPVSGWLKTHELANDMRARFGGRFTFGYVRYSFDLFLHYLGALARGASDSTIAGGSGVVGWLTTYGLIAVAIAGAVVLARGGRPRWSPPAFALGCVGAVVFVKALVDVVSAPYWITSWYSAPGRIAAGLGAGVLVAVAIRALWRRNQLEAIAVAGLVAIFVMPMASSDLRLAPSAKPRAGFWQDTQLEAVAWIKAHGPAGVYGSTDAGVLGYSLDPRPVVDLDGLVNSYSYGEQLAHHVPALDRYRSQGVTVLIERALPGSPQVPACARLLWTSPDEIVYGGSADQPQVTRIPLGIFDLKACGSNG